jgi:prepilin-type processing-associated H-X9-DG protein
MYAQDHEETLPDTGTVWNAIAVDPVVLVCPSLGKTTPNGYGYSKRVGNVAIGTFTDPTQVILLGDAATGLAGNILTKPTQIDKRHSGSAICAYADGHVGTEKEPLLFPYPSVPITSGLVFWLTADSITGMSNVTSWKDSNSGSSLAANYSAGTIKYLRSGMNGNPTVSFIDSPYSYLSTSDLSSKFTGATGGSVFLVFNSLTTGSNYVEPFWASGRGDTFTSFGGTAYPGCFLSNRYDSACAGMPINTTGPSRVAYTATTTSGANSYNIYLNGTNKASLNYASSNANVWKAPAVCRVGCNSTINGGINGYVSEVVMFNRVLSASEIQTIDDYQKDKWGM